eukprot:1161625-Pelagomonas_calceolata.AAC.1
MKHLWSMSPCLAHRCMSSHVQCALTPRIFRFHALLPLAAMFRSSRAVMRFKVPLGSPNHNHGRKAGHGHVCFWRSSPAPHLKAKEQTVWYPDSAAKTAAAIEEFALERLPLIILANWRGFSGGQGDLFAGVLQGLRMTPEQAPCLLFIPQGSSSTQMPLSAGIHPMQAGS